MSGTGTSNFETEDARPVAAWSTGGMVHVRLKDSREISVPLWWYPFLDRSTDEQLNDIELMFEGIWWNHADEGVSVKSMLLGVKSHGAKQPAEAA